MIRILSVQIGRARAYPDPAAGAWRSAIAKSPVSGRVRVDSTGLEGDEQADRRVHGGPDKAILAYARKHYSRWRDIAGMESIGPGGFGENLTVEGLDESSVAIGDVWEVGSVRLEVCQPRGPCVKLARRWGQPELPRLVTETASAGWYLRVLAPGALGAGDAIRVAASPQPAATVARVFRLGLGVERDPDSARLLAATTALCAGWQKKLRAASLA